MVFPPIEEDGRIRVNIGVVASEDEGVSDTHDILDEVSTASYRLNMLTGDISTRMMCVNLHYVIIPTTRGHKHLCTSCYVVYIHRVRLAGRHDHVNQHFQFIMRRFAEVQQRCYICNTLLSQALVTDSCHQCNTG